MMMNDLLSVVDEFCDVCCLFGAFVVIHITSSNKFKNLLIHSLIILQRLSKIDLQILSSILDRCLLPMSTIFRPFGESYSEAKMLLKSGETRCQIFYYFSILLLEDFDRMLDRILDTFSAFSAGE